MYLLASFLIKTTGQSILLACFSVSGAIFTAPAYFNNKSNHSILAWYWIECRCHIPRRKLPIFHWFQRARLQLLTHLSRLHLTNSMLPSHLLHQRPVIIMEMVVVFSNMEQELSMETPEFRWGSNVTYYSFLLFFSILIFPFIIIANNGVKGRKEGRIYIISL